MSLQNFYEAEQLADEKAFEVLLCAVFISCSDVKKGEELKALFPKTWEYVYRSYLDKRIKKTP